MNKVNFINYRRDTNLHEEMVLEEEEEAESRSSMMSSSTMESEQFPRKGSKRKREIDPVDAKLLQALEQGMKEESENECFGKMIAKRLDALSNKMDQAMARHKIDELLMQFEFGISQSPETIVSGSGTYMQLH